MKKNFSIDELQYKLDKIAAASVRPLDIDSVCKVALRALVMEGVKRMEIEGRVADADVAIASANLKRFVHEMKTESVFLGHPQRLDYDSYRAAHRRIEDLAVLTSFTLWPFWPGEYVISHEWREDNGGFGRIVRGMGNRT